MFCSAIVTVGNTGSAFEAVREFAANHATPIVMTDHALAIEMHAVEPFDLMGGNATSRTFQMSESLK